MFDFLKKFESLKKRSYPIGVDMADEVLKLVQLRDTGKGLSLLAGASDKCPLDIKPGSSSWQRWAIEALKHLVSNSDFCGRNIVAAMPASEVFIDQIKNLKADDENLEQTVLSKIRHKLPFNTDDVMLRHIPTEGGNVIVIATERAKIDRHLAIYEEADLRIKSIAIWPDAMASCYARFFGRRRSDLKAVVMLLDIEKNHTKVVICRHSNFLFVRLIPIGKARLKGEQADEMMVRLVLELEACRKQFQSMYNNSPMERLVFLSPCHFGAFEQDVFTTIAKKMAMPAQIGDCLAAVEILSGKNGPAIDRREPDVNWATAFGLSLS